jgi:hypothetical protein
MAVCFTPVGNRSPSRGKGSKVIDNCSHGAGLPKLLAGQEWGKGGFPQSKGRVRHVAGDRGRRFYRIEPRGRAE